MIDWQATLYGPVYSTLSVPAQLSIGDTDQSAVTLSAIDKTAGILVGDQVGIQTIKPACDIRAKEFFATGLVRDDLSGASITFNGKTWDITHHEVRPGPEGEALGELRLFLSEQDG